MFKQYATIPDREVFGSNTALDISTHKEECMVYKYWYLLVSIKVFYIKNSSTNNISTADGWQRKPEYPEVNHTHK